MVRSLFAFLVIAVFLWIASPLMMPVLMGGIFAIVLFPAMQWLQVRKASASLASALVTLGVTLVVFLPTSIMTYLAVKTAFVQLQALKEKPGTHGDLGETLFSLPFIQTIVRWVGEWFPMAREDFTDAIQDLARSASIKAAEFLGSVLSGLPMLVLALAVIVVSVYFFLVDGQRLINYIRRHSFFEPGETDRLLGTLESGCRSVVLASIVSGACQAGVATIAFVLGGIPYALVLGATVFIASFIPVIGTAPVAFGVVIHQFVSGNTGTGIAMLVVAIIVTTMDNLIRPAFLRGSVNLHPLLAFVAAFGGLQTLGFAGVFLGPILAALFVTTIQVIFKEPADSPMVGGPLA